MDEKSVALLKSAMQSLEQWEARVPTAPAAEQFAIEKLRALLPELREEIQTLLAEHDRN